MRWVAVGAWMAVIFLFSAQTGGDSAGLSGRVAEALAAVLPLEVELVHVGVRKGAHVAVYAVLGALLAWALRARTWRAAALTLAIGVGYAATDEIHQSFVPGRVGAVGDVALDAAGVALGVILARAGGYIGRHVRLHRHPHRRGGALR